MPDARTDIDEAILSYLAGDVVAAVLEAIQASIGARLGATRRSLLRLRRGGWIRQHQGAHGRAWYFLTERTDQALAELTPPQGPAEETSLFAVLGAAEAMARVCGLGVG